MPPVFVCTALTQLGPGLGTALLLYCNGNNHSNHVFSQDCVLKGWSGQYKGVSFRVFSGFNQKEEASFLLLWDPAGDNAMHRSAEHDNPTKAVGHQSLLTPH